MVTPVATVWTIGTKIPAMQGQGLPCPVPRMPDERGANIGAPLPQIVQWFKTMTTNGYILGVKHRGWAAFQGELWQHNYYEHVIRSEDELDHSSRRTGRWLSAAP